MYKNWKSLLEERCPMCGYKLDKKENDYRVCVNMQCDFSITKYSFREQEDRLKREEMESELEGYGRE